MKRRKFLLTSGSAILGGGTLSSISQQPALGLNFDLVGINDVQPSTVDSLLIGFQNFELVPQYVDENASDATVTINLDVDEHSPVENQATVQFQNGKIVDNSNLGSATPIVLDSVDTDATSLGGTITITVDHPSVSDSYQQSFTITGDSSQNAPKEGLVGWWPLHEWSGRANDLSGNDNHGTVNGSSQGVWGRGGLTSYHQDSSTDYVRMPQSAWNGGGDEMTVSAWFRWDGSFESHLIRIRGDDLVFFDFQSTAIDGKDGLSNRIKDSNGNKHVITIPFDDLSNLEPNKWTHGALTYNRSGKMKVYIDGVVVGSTSVPDNSVVNFQNDAYTKNDGFGQAFRGYIQDIRSYNRVLSESEVQSLYDRGSGDYTQQSLHNGNDSGTVSRYKFDSGSVTEDSWGNNSLSDSTDLGTDKGVRGDSNKFNGSSDYMSIDGTKDLLDGVSEFSISGWFRLESLPSKHNDMSIISSYEYLGNGKSAGINFSLGSGDNIVAGYYYGDGSSSDYVTTDKILSSDDWYHVCWTKNSKNSTIYLNGVKASEIQSSTDSINGSSLDLSIGYRETSSERFFYGALDDIRIFNRSLSPVEVQQLYQWGTRGKDLRERTTTLNNSDMLGWWKLNETSGSTAYDSSNNGNDGSINGADLGNISSPLDQTAYEFDSSNNDDIEFNFGSSLFSGPTTVSTWIKPYTLSKEMYIAENYINGAGFIIRIDDTTSTGQFNLDFYYRNDSTGYTDNVYVGDDIISADSWYHIVAVKTGQSASNMRLYVDGIDETLVDNDSGASLIGGNNNLYVGSDNSSGLFFDGAISDMRIYDRGLTPQEVSYLYEQQF